MISNVSSPVLVVLCGLKLLLGAGEGRCGHNIAAVEPRKLAPAPFAVEKNNVGIGPASAFLLGYHIMTVGYRGYLRQVRNAHDLLAL